MFNLREDALGQRSIGSGHLALRLIGCDRQHRVEAILNCDRLGIGSARRAP
jgi:hypothetical protein